MTVKRRERPLKKFPQILVGFLLAIYCLFFVWRAWACISSPFPVEYGEGAVLYEVTHLAQGQPLYTSNILPPYQAVVYGPLYYFLNAVPLSFLSDPTFAFGRLLSVVAGVGAGFCIFYATRSFAGKWTALAAALTPFATAPVYAWGTLFKPDMLATVLSLGAVTLVYACSSEPVKVSQDQARDKSLAVQAFKTLTPFTWWKLVLAAVLCVLAFYIKQSAFAAPVSIFVFLLWKWPRRAVVFGTVFAGMSLLAGVFFQLVTQGQFLPHFISYNGQNFEFSWLLTALGYLLQTYFVLLGLSVYWIVRGRGLELWKIYWVVALLVTFSVGKVGSNLNYYLELMFISSLLSWRLLYQWWQERPKLKLASLKIPLAATAFLLLALQLLLLHHIPVVADGANTPGPQSTLQAQQIALALRQYAANGPLLVEDAGWLPPLHLNTDLDDSFVFGQLAEGGQWKQEGFVEQLANGHYKTVMLQLAGADSLDDAQLTRLVTSNQYQPFPGRFSSQMLALFHTHFQMDKRIGTTLFLTWKL